MWREPRLGGGFDAFDSTDNPNSVTANFGTVGGGYGNTDADFASTSENLFLIRAAGGVGINTNDPAGFALNVAGNIQCVSLTQTSDARYKQNIAPFDHALDAILNLRGVTFDWKSTPGRYFMDGKQIGFIAQEVQKDGEIA
jgi:hypothetical protein